MGKETGQNVASNPSVSMALEDFRTTVELTLDPNAQFDRWEPLENLCLAKSGQDRFLTFFKSLKDKEGITENFILRSGNNFPADAGLASSASSFAALTLVAYTAFSELNSKPIPSIEDLANISRAGSGSSCRSFFSPWCSWNGNDIHAVDSKLPRLVDFVAVLNHGTKKVPSSEAHKRVRTSPLFEKRSERAHFRWEKALAAIASGDFKALARIAWSDMWDMHSLFHTSEPSFSYFEPLTISVLNFSEGLWEKTGSGPITTIDAGPNVHMLVPDSEHKEFRARFREHFSEIPLLESR